MKISLTLLAFFVALAGFRWGDRGDGTYANPVMPADASDLDAIRVGSDFYAITSTFQYSPGVAVLHSRDLVNWRIAGHVVDDLKRIGPELNYDRMNRQGRGIWAGSIRFHAGRYWVYFFTPDEGLFMSTASHAEGPWEPLKAVWRVTGWDDPCPFWDDDGQAYLVASHFQREEANGQTYNIHLFAMNGAGDALIPESDRIIHQSRGSEANKLYKIDGLYYHLYSEVHNEGRVAMMNRARSLQGPWETRQLNHVNKTVDKEPNQGGLIELASGKWFFLSHQGTGSWEGRAGVLLPVTWIDGWPVIGSPGADGIGNMTWNGRKPIAGGMLTSLAASDTFDGRRLRPEWEWNYQPRADRWSLTERAGFLRLHAFQPLRAGDIRTVGNILTQRSLMSARSQATVKIDLTGLAEGQRAGLVHYAKTSSAFGVTRRGAETVLTLDSAQGPVIGQKTIWLRSTWDAAGVSQFSYSLNGRDFLPFGEPYQLTWGSYRGDRIGLYSYNEAAEAGYVDIDSFNYEVAR